MGCREGVGNPKFGEDDDGAVNRDPQPQDVRVPKERAALPGQGEVVHKILARLDRALRYVRRTIVPPRT